MTPLIAGWLGDAPPPLSAVDAAESPLICAGCGLSGSLATDYRRQLGDGALLCPVCALGPLAPWEPARVRLAVIPELPQGRLNALMIRLTVHRLQVRAGAVPRSVDARLQAQILDGFQRRAALTRHALPWAASPALLRHTLRALPTAQRAVLMAELDGLRYLPEPTDPTLARFFNHRRRLAV